MRILRISICFCMTVLVLMLFRTNYLVQKSYFGVKSGKTPLEELRANILL